MRLQWIIGIILAGLILNIFILYWLFFRLSSSVEQELLATPVPLSQNATTTDSQDSNESSPNTTTVSTADCSGDCLDELEGLKSRVIDLENSLVTSQQQPASQASTSISSAKEVVISLGSGDTYSKEWVDVPGASAYIDSNNYSNIKTALFEASVRIPNAQGKVHARLYNKTDDHPVWYSEVSTETDVSTLLQSKSITLDNGNKLYQVQLKSTIGVQVIIDSSRVKITLQ